MIDVQLAQATNEIVLNSLNLEISSAEVIAGGKTQQAKVSYDQPNEIIRLTVAEAIPPDRLHCISSIQASLLAGCAACT